ncbi:unnamed protein product [Lepeophtheirus salmonis]|uniref:(salmon louse) hypothetical protein n=1 Tax=Lepeophtheirus salmonis TaxID=72036 RepID=A0A7R8D554_LEPSM|nr:unnamed protein product [Lepeophtheirus salmonis]CAF3031623.1 unnamed protein product [Lepeophtheirus salmonis]
MNNHKEGLLLTQESLHQDSCKDFTHDSEKFPESDQRLLQPETQLPSSGNVMSSLTRSSSVNSLTIVTKKRVKKKSKGTPKNSKPRKKDLTPPIPHETAQWLTDVLVGHCPKELGILIDFLDGLGYMLK